MKIKSSFSAKSSKFHTSSSKSGTLNIPLDLLIDLQQVLQESKIPSIFVSQLSQLINSKTKSNNSTRTSGKNDFKSNVETMNFLGFQRKLTNYIQNSGLNRFTRDFDIKIKEMYGLTKRTMPNVARELLELNIYDKNISSFINNFDKIRKHFDNNFNNYNSTNSKKNTNSNHKKCQEIFDQISKQISSNENILEYLKSLNSYLNTTNTEITNNKKEYLNSEYQNTDNNNEFDNFSSPSIDDIIDSKNNNFNQTQLLTLAKFTNTSNTSSKSKNFQDQLIQNEIKFLNEQRLALQTALELQQNMTELKSEVCFLTQTVEENELIKGLIEIEEEFLIESSKDVERVKTINDSIHAILNGDSTVSTVDFDNMKLKSEVAKIENNISNIQQKMNFLAKKPIHNLPLLKKSKKLIKKQLNTLATNPIPPQLQKLKNDQLSKKISFLREENDKISIQRAEFDNFEALSNHARKCQNDYYQLKDVYEENLSAKETSQFDDENNDENTDESSFNDDNYCRQLLSSRHHKYHRHESEGKSKKKAKNINRNQLQKIDILHLLHELQDEYSICMSNIERITNRKNQERLLKKRKFIKRQRSFLNELLTTAYECSEELKENFEIEAELFEEASQRGIDVDSELSDIVFDCMKKSEMNNTITEKCNEVAEMIEFCKNENRSRSEKEVSYCFNNCDELVAGIKEIIDEKGKERCDQLLRIFNLKKELEEAKKQK